MQLSKYGFMYLCVQCSGLYRASCYHPSIAFANGLCIARNRMQDPIPERLTTIEPEPVCSTHPDALHGFNRNGSHNAGRYVCDCEGWEP